MFNQRKLTGCRPCGYIFNVSFQRGNPGNLAFSSNPSRWATARHPSQHTQALGQSPVFSRRKTLFDPIRLLFRSGCWFLISLSFTTAEGEKRKGGKEIQNKALSELHRKKKCCHHKQPLFVGGPTLLGKEQSVEATTMQAIHVDSVHYIQCEACQLKQAHSMLWTSIRYIPFRTINYFFYRFQ